MAKIRVVLDVEVSADDLRHRQIGKIADSIKNSVNGINNEQPEWYTVFCKSENYTPVTTKLYNVERIIDEDNNENL